MRCAFGPSLPVRSPALAPLLAPEGGAGSVAQRSGHPAPTHPELRFRQVHLDFHTSEHIEGIGAAFDPEEFASTLARAHVDSVTCFARCHHGWIYYETTTHPERRHPHLGRDLLGEQIRACHARNIRVPIYTTVQWDHYTAMRHPEWLVVDEKGAPRGTPLYEPGFYRTLCVNSPYRNFLLAHVRDLVTAVPAVDGLFFDIVHAQDCSCRHCRERMTAEGLDPADAASRRAFGARTIDQWQREMTAFVRGLHPDCTVFYNGGHVGPRHRATVEAYTHYELESLPSGGWGYLHFPVTMRYARTIGPDCLGMTGKFHTSWGDFHSFKNEAALQFECFRMLAMGAKCSVGDQLHPSGRIDGEVYDLIGGVYREVERKEPWCRGADPLTDIAVFTPEAFGAPGRLSAPIKGATRILEEGGHQFDIVDAQSDLAPYRVVILPDEIPVDAALAGKLQAHLDRGGALLASHRAGLTPQGDRFALPALGIRLVGPAQHSPEFLRPSGAVGKGLPQTEHVMYLRGLEVATEAADAEVLAPTIQPYFNRTHAHFCSHRHTPSAGRTGHPGIVRCGRAIYFSHPVFTQYDKNAPRWCKRLVHNALDLLLPEPLLRHDGPSTLQVTCTAQPSEGGRQVLHLLHYIPERRGEDFDVIEDVIPLRDVGLSVRADGLVGRVACVPDGPDLRFAMRGARVEFTVPEVVGHQMIEIVPAR